jgi:hypothetical protein
MQIGRIRRQKNCLMASMVMMKITDQFGTPRGRYDEHSSKFSLSKKPRFIESKKKSILQTVMLASLLTLQQGRR